MLTDFHTHILPEMDDGSESVNQSLQMLQTLYDQNVQTVVLTPHFDLEFENIDCFFNRRETAMQQLVQGITNASVAVPRMVLGAEVYLNPTLYHLEDLDRLCIEGTKYMLIEMPFDNWANHVYRVLEDLQSKGIRPIIAHVDRYVLLQDRFRNIVRLSEMGALMQLNTDCVKTFSGRRVASKLLRSGMVNLLGSDCHDVGQRSPDIQPALDWLLKKVGRKRLDEIERTAANILGESL